MLFASNLEVHHVLKVRIFQIDISALREAEERGEIEEIVWCDTHHMLADSLTKHFKKGYYNALTECMKTGFIEVGLSPKKAAQIARRKRSQKKRVSRKSWYKDFVKYNNSCYYRKENAFLAYV